MTPTLADASHWADVAAVPFFALAVWYFASIPWRRRSLVEWALLLFALAGLLLDTLFSLDWWWVARVPQQQTEERRWRRRSGQRMNE